MVFSGFPMIIEAAVLGSWNSLSMVSTVFNGFQDFAMVFHRSGSIRQLEYITIVVFNSFSMVFCGFQQLSKCQYSVAGMNCCSMVFNGCRSGSIRQLEYITIVVFNSFSMVFNSCQSVSIQ